MTWGFNEHNLPKEGVVHTDPRHSPALNRDHPDTTSTSVPKLEKMTNPPNPSNNATGFRIPGFDPYAYGHPARRSQTHSASRGVISTPPTRSTKNIDDNSETKSAAKANYQSLKLDGETREQTLQRLQMQNIQKISIAAMKANDRHGIETTNLAELKALRIENKLDSEGSTTDIKSSLADRIYNPDKVSSHMPRATLGRTKSPNQGNISSSTVLQHDTRQSSQGLCSGEYRQDSSNNLHDDHRSSNLDPNGFPHTGDNTHQLQRFNWVTHAEIKAPAWSTDSNAERSETDFDSVGPMGAEFGRLIHKPKPNILTSPLAGWDGQFQPPPVDWDQRPRFQADTEDVEFKNSFRTWLGSTLQLHVANHQVPKFDFKVQSKETLLNLNNHADGIGFVARDQKINSTNADRYGYDFKSDDFHIDPTSVADFDADCSMDMSIPQNALIKDETSNMFIKTKTAAICRDNERQEAAQELRKATRELAKVKTSTNTPPTEPRRPKANFYLRPAVRSDVPGMAAILNWHIANGPRTSELNPVSDEDMRRRLTMVQDSMLPFIVAIERGRGNARKKTTVRTTNPSHPIQNIDPAYSGVVKDEHIVGWASATDWSATDYVECITADLECYVAHDFRRKGVGRCLLDALLDATDRGYTKVGGYSFHVAQDLVSHYSCGGKRDLNKIIFQIRSYTNPLSLEAQWRRHNYTVDSAFTGGGYTAGVKVNSDKLAIKPDFSSKTAKFDDREDDYQVWLKTWLESFGFSEEACIKEMGTKNRRFLDLRYMTRKTYWAPVDGALPNFAEEDHDFDD